MKTITIYKCELCGRSFDNAPECEECESKHIKPVEIVGENAGGALFDYYPTYVVIKFDNGETKKYYWDRLM